ncbi:putative peptidoglycan lipid II flippase MurJ [Serinicoccus hydrothermalis]|uniref:Putative peptidoglycan lipid II flippase MurJ n=1 Tax=Serinicoccus hydrothermalis TaxID=1758689 RepID=A0A1B1ND13_9MICO|nr:lipid II flippase MurJ [Serinicoccus hydrothermalis]ANS79281.1 putative peptidoglycan lipid II flippase MurJ [Serinicoccus hydrothermalis]
MSERQTSPTRSTAGSSSSLARSSAVMAGGTLASRLLGMARMALLGIAIGVLTPAGSVWDTANTIPNTIYLLLAAGVFNVLLLPQLTRAMTRGREGQEYSDRLITVSVSILVVATVVFVAAAPLVTKVYALSWAWDDPKLQLAVLFAYLCIPQMLFYGLHTILGQILAAHHRFAAFTWSPALANVIAIVGIAIFMRRYPDAGTLPLQDWTGGMIGLLAGSATLGIVVQALVLFPAVRATGFRWQPRWGFRGVGLGTAAVMAGWAIADMAVSQGGMLVVTNLLSNVIDEVPDAPGKITYTYAFSLFVLPHSLIALSLLTAIYPVLSKDAAADDLSSMADHTSRGLRLLGAAMVPIALGMMLLTPLLVRVVYFGSSPAEHRAVAAIVLAMVVGLVPYGVYLLCSRVFYSFEDARTPFLFQVSITSVLLLVCLVAAFAPPARVAVLLGLGQALGQGTAAVLGLRAARRRLPELGLRRTGATYLRAAGAALIALVPAWVVVRVLDRGAPPDPSSMDPQGVSAFLSAALTLTVAGLVYLAVYALLAHRFGVREVTDVAAPVLRRIPGLRRLAPAGGVPLVDVEEPAAAAAAGPPVDPGGAAPPTGAATSDEDAAPGTLGWDRDHRRPGEDSSMDRLEVGTRLGDRYVLDELLAEREGGGLEYWSARDATLGRLVAVTVLPSQGESAEIAEAVLDGARRVASVDDPRLVRVLDVGERDGLCWIVEEGLSEAESLASLVEQHPVPAEEARRIVGESAAALESARRRGLHHLYLNPHSVLRTTDGTVKVSGVGVASALEGTDDVTADEASLIDAADLVSLLYTALTGRWPGEDLAGVRPARRLADGTLPAPSELVSGVPGDLDALCRLAHGSEADLQSAPHTPGELAHQLSPWASEIVRAARPDELQPPRGTRGEDHRAEDALRGTAGASAAATAARPSHADDSPQASGEPTDEVPQPYYRTQGRSAAGSGSGAQAVPERPGNRTDDTMGGLLRGGEARQERADRAQAAAGATALATQRPEDDDGLREERGTGAQTAMVVVIILALLAIALFLGWSVLRGLGGGDEDPAGAGATSPPSASEPAADEDASTATGETPTEEGSTEQAPEPAAAVAVEGITSFDPEGDGDERNDLAPLAVDGDEGTEWTSHTYLSPGWGSLKNGTGLILDLGEDATVSEVEVVLGEGDMGATLYLSDSPSLEDATELGSDDAAEGTWTVSPDEPATGRYLILWFTRAYTAPEGEIVRVAEITVR